MAYSTIIKPSDYFDTKLYTGNASTNAITGVGFQPDMAWLKQRNSTPDHYLYDAIRGVQNYITPNLATQQQANATSLTAFNSDGFTLGSNAATNANSGTFASWNWKANGSGSSNSDGNITSTVSANTTSGFSIVKYTGNGVIYGGIVGHGLGKVPKMMMVKNLSAGETDWMVYHASLGATKNMRLNNTDAIATSSAMWNNTTPTSSLFYLSNNGNVNASGQDYVAYCFADVPGFSKMGEYAANANADGPFIYLGFKPACIILKQYNTNGSNWFLFDNKRVGFNIENYYIAPDTSGTEGTTDKLDMLSNGFKIKTSNSDVNGGDFIYMAWAETPFVANSGESIPTTAR